MGAGALEESRPLTIRAFFGLPVPEPQREELGRFITECAALAPNFRWTAISNLHLTIRFIGSVDRDVVEAIADRLGAQARAGFEIELGEIGTFKRSRLVRVVWLGLRSGAEAARALAAKVEAECVSAGLEADQRAFTAHVTLARARPRDGSELPALPAVPQLGSWRAGELVLFSSHLSKSGAIHEPIRSVPLQ
jgi:RNA 2',3'-cyclic 3'-phosphodiesterase